VQMFVCVRCHAREEVVSVLRPDSPDSEPSTLATIGFDSGELIVVPHYPGCVELDIALQRAEKREAQVEEFLQRTAGRDRRE
jgi:hypothetical protein